MKLLKLFGVIILIFCFSGCSSKPASTSYDVDSLQLEFDTFLSEDYVPITNVLLVVNEDKSHRLFVGRYFVSFQLLDNSTDWDVMDNSISNYFGWYAGGGVIISLVKEGDEYFVYEKYIDEGVDDTLSQFEKVTSITVDNPSVKLLDHIQNQVETTEQINVILEDEIAITEANWTTHPDITEIRAIYNSIEESIESNELAVSIKNITNDLSLPKDITIYKDEHKMIRKYKEQNGSEDSAYTASYYYDNLNKIRFVFLELGAINGTNKEYRLYYDEKGNKIWEQSKLLKGPGYPFGTVDDYVSIPVIN